MTRTIMHSYIHTCVRIYICIYHIHTYIICVCTNMYTYIICVCTNIYTYIICVCTNKSSSPFGSQDELLSAPL